MAMFQKYSQHFAALAASLLALVAGNVLAWTTPILPKLMGPDSPLGFPVTNTQAALITSFLMFGNIFGNLIVGPCINYLGRKQTLLFCGIPLFLFWIAIYFIKSVPLLYAARFILGFIAAFPVGACVIYITEIAEPHNRGKLGILVMFNAEIGQIMVTVIGSYMSYGATALLCSIVPVVFGLVFCWFPESPYHYLRKGDVKNARKCLRRLRANSVSEELIIIEKNVKADMERKSGIKEVLLNSEYRMEMLIIIGLKSLHQLSGNSAIQSYMGIIFDLASTGLDTITSTIICTSITIPAMFISFYCVDRFGRKPLYYVSTIGCTISLLCEFTYFLLQDSLQMNMKSFAWLPLSGIFLFYIFRSFGVTTLAHLIMGELFPTNIKGAAVSISLFYGSILAFLVSLGFPLLVRWLGLSFVFLLFAIFCFLGFIFVLFYVPETKGKSFEEIQKEIKFKSESTLL